MLELNVGNCLAMSTPPPPGNPATWTYLTPHVSQIALPVLCSELTGLRTFKSKHLHQLSSRTQGLQSQAHPIVTSSHYFVVLSWNRRQQRKIKWPGLPPPFLHAASNQKVDSGKAWEQEYSNSTSGETPAGLALGFLHWSFQTRLMVNALIVKLLNLQKTFYDCDCIVPTVCAVPHSYIHRDCMRITCQGLLYHSA